MITSNSRILVTGGLGFIGSHLVEKLLERDCSVTVFDNLDDFYPGKEENVKLFSKEKKYKLLRGDLLDLDALNSAIRDSNMVFHLAAQAGVRYCNEQPLKANRVNVDGTLNVLMLAKKHKIAKIVYASSSSIFGDPLYLPIDEKHPANPNSPYGVSKLAAEQYCKVFCHVYGMDISFLRYFSVYGPRGRPDQVIYAFADRISRGIRPVIYGDGEQTRDFTFVSDVVDATILAMESEKSKGEAFNIGRGSRFTINELASKVISLMGADSLQPTYEEESKGDFPDTEADAGKARKLLGWEPRIGLDEGLAKFIEWFLKERATNGGPRANVSPVK